jgi:hypothetical protein
MASMTYCVVLACTRSDGGDIFACDPKEAAVRAKRCAQPTGDDGRALRSHRMSRSSRNLQEAIDIADHGQRRGDPVYAR